MPAKKATIHKRTRGEKRADVFLVVFNSTAGVTVEAVAEVCSIDPSTAIKMLRELADTGAVVVVKATIWIAGRFRDVDPDDSYYKATDGLCRSRFQAKNLGIAHPHEPTPPPPPPVTPRAGPAPPPPPIRHRSTK